MGRQGREYIGWGAVTKVKQKKTFVTGPHPMYSLKELEKAGDVGRAGKSGMAREHGKTRKSGLPRDPGEAEKARKPGRSSCGYRGSRL